MSPSQNADADMSGGFNCLCCCDPDAGGCGEHGYNETTKQHDRSDRFRIICPF